MKRDEMKARVRKLVKEMQEPRTMSGFRQMAGEMEGMPTSFGSALSAGKPVGERIAELPASLKKPVEAMVLSILELIEQTVEEKGMTGAEAIAQGVSQGLKSRGMQLGMPAVTEGTAVVPKDKHKEKVEKHLADIEKSVPNMRKTDKDRVRSDLHALMQQADKQFGGGEKVSESAIRSEIRRVLLEQDPLAKDEKKEGGKEGEKNSKLTDDEKMAMRTLLTKLDMQGQVSQPKWDEVIQMIRKILELAAENSEGTLDRSIGMFDISAVGKQATRAHDRLADRGRLPGKGEGR